MDELKKCPFCGKTANLFLSDQLQFIVEGEPKRTYYTIKCGSCFCGIGFYATIDRAIEAWNRRAD